MDHNNEHHMIKIRILFFSGFFCLERACRLVTIAGAPILVRYQPWQIIAANLKTRYPHIVSTDNIFAKYLQRLDFMMMLRDGSSDIGLPY